ncbi:MAG: Fic family protein [Daejeonella sp.]
MSTTFQRNGKTYTVVFALRRDTYECLDKELTERATVSNQQIDELIADIDSCKGCKTRCCSQTPIEPVYNEDGTLKRSKDEMLRYTNALNTAIGSNVDLTEENIKMIHAILFTNDLAYRGKFKSQTNDLILPTKHPDRKIIVATTPPRDTQRELGYLIKWANQNLAKKNFHPLIVISTFIYEFLLIHPFQDGNGRTSRILTHLLLMKTGYQFAESSSLDQVIWNDRCIHREVLLVESFNRNSEHVINLQLWIRYYLITISVMIKQVEIQADGDLALC